jgi:hypothetical protein
MLSQKDMERFNRRVAAIEGHYRKRKRVAVEYIDVLTALMAVYGEKNPEVLCAQDLPEAEMLAKLEGHAFDAPAILGEIEAPDLDVPGGIGRVYAALNRGAGKEWEILSHPPDPFPSDPCAHNETEDVSLDLATGALYHDRQFVHKLFRKDLVAFRGKISEKYPELRLPPLRG